MRGSLQPLCQGTRRNSGVPGLAMIGLTSAFYLSMSHPKHVTRHAINDIPPSHRDNVFTLLTGSMHSFLIKSLDVGGHTRKRGLSEGAETGEEESLGLLCRGGLPLAVRYDAEGSHCQAPGIPAFRPNST